MHVTTWNRAGRAEPRASGRGGSPGRHDCDEDRVAVGDVVAPAGPQLAFQLAIQLELGGGCLAGRGPEDVPP